MKYWDDHCYCCDKELRDNPSYFTCEFDAYICVDCYNKIMSTETHDPEEEIIYNEFMHKEQEAAIHQTLYSQSNMPAQKFNTVFKMNDVEVSKDLFYESLRYDAEEEFEDSMDFIAAETLGIVNIEHFIKYLHGKGFIDDLENEYISDLYDQAYMNGGVEVNNNKYETIMRGENV